MHEMGVAMEVIRIARDEAKSIGAAARVVGLRLRVGRWSGVEPESLRFCLEALTDDTELNGCRLDITMVEPEFQCGQCMQRYPADSYFVPCPQCGGAAELVAGDELTLAELEVEEP